jgi:hypothetical protein
MLGTITFIDDADADPSFSENGWLLLMLKPLSFIKTAFLSTQMVNLV